MNDAAFVLVEIIAAAFAFMAIAFAVRMGVLSALRQHDKDKQRRY